jgi:hypothetical protein
MNPAQARPLEAPPGPPPVEATLVGPSPPEPVCAASDGASAAPGAQAAKSR